MTKTRSKHAADIASGSAVTGSIQVRREGGKIWSHVRTKWLIETPEEAVRQQFLAVLVNEYGYAIEQIDEELSVVGRGAAQARADFAIWVTAEDKAKNKSPLIVVECKADNVTIRDRDYEQGDHYARLADAKFFVTHNSRETKFWRVMKGRMPGTIEEIANIPHAGATQREIEELLAQLKTFREDEFAALLHECHNVIRNRDHLDPAAAFDEIAKILFVKTWVERELKEKRRRKNLFNVEYLDELLGDDPLNQLFDETKKYYRTDDLFEKDERINLKPATGKEIVRRLERYNLSDTSEDIKGIAFERFLGKTFRGEIGQFFTPRSVVEFMIRMIQPKEGDVICDPASGSGGFLIRFFEIVRQQIMASADEEYRTLKAAIEKQKLSEAEKAKVLRSKWDQIQSQLDQRNDGSRLWDLANRRIYGTDANDRMARTSKMNMIMHGDGHGGVHHHNGFLNVNGIFESRFDVILTNPPFGASVEPSDKVQPQDVEVLPESYRRYKDIFGDLYVEAQQRAKAAVNKPIASLFELPFGEPAEDGERSAREIKHLGKIKTEILFIERCIDLLKPGGRLGIVLPDGILNNPSLQYVREFCENRGYVRAIVSLPEETFVSTGATVKASLLFWQRFSTDEQERFNRTDREAEAEIRAKHQPAIDSKVAEFDDRIAAAKEAKDTTARKEAERERRAFLTKMETQITEERRRLLRERFNYPIFMYDAQRVGITATGEPDANELYPNERVPSEIPTGQTAIELYEAFLREHTSHFSKARQHDVDRPRHSKAKHSPDGKLVRSTRSGRGGARS